MHKDQYLILSNEQEANSLIAEIDSIIGEHWIDPVIHPENGTALVGWNNEYLSEANHLLEGKKTISFKQAIDGGWMFGIHQGRFGKAKLKIEEALAIRDSLNLFDNYPNFPAYRALFNGLLASLYGVKEALRKSCKNLSGDAWTWWESTFQHIERDPLLSLFYRMHNQDKHDLEQSLLQPRAKIFGYRGPTPEHIGAEGVSITANAGTKDEERRFLGGVDAEFECYLVTDDGNFHPPCVKSQIDIVLEFYKNLVWEAENKFGANAP